MASIVIFGDSITRGAFDLEKSGWANRLTMFLWKKNYKKTNLYYRGLDTDIFAVDGDTVLDVLKRFDFELETVEKWDIAKIFFAIGINDSSFENGEKRSSKKNFRTDLEKLIKKALKKTKAENIYFIGLTNIDCDIVQTDFKEERVADFDKIVQEISEKYSCQFIAMQGLLGKEDLADGLHPNANGHEKMFLRIKDFCE